MQGGAHERNRTADLLLTMQMLYRLSYVGVDRLGLPGGQHRTVGPASQKGRCTGLKTWLSVPPQKDALPQADFLLRKSSGTSANIEI